jgi:hypothetical protein
MPEDRNFSSLNLWSAIFRSAIFEMRSLNAGL